ncbi:MAG TPA: T9SS type A sorting domain-containing protein [Bacteroidales bacterium]|nr:T9SS type A sorting domain-containing protein [Bacteroidales bacterium]HPB26323.1 T9SS type A sorting domain-containing protein [Bacteroidales bacterium]HPI31401.1 T9SS type A sorting domain-containing protein [Bacteroidales bacterium]HQN17227.1 T9SS type A sorting domain-containing protein [Bacteroidales bacterium]HQP16798.1 T9SS type A sorting domain-containing protein [Bacteroidales bacterium]
MKKFFSAILFFGLFLTGARAQEIHETIPATGGNVSGSNGTVSYTVGQFVYTTHTGANGTISQGVQQPYEISIMTQIEEATGTTLTITAFPNPATDCLTLRTDIVDNQNLSFHLYDINGNVIQENKINSAETSLLMKELPPSIYFLEVSDNSKIIKVFKIVKN